MSVFLGRGGVRQGENTCNLSPNLLEERMKKKDVLLLIEEQQKRQPAVFTGQITSEIFYLLLFTSKFSAAWRAYASQCVFLINYISEALRDNPKRTLIVVE